MEHTGFYHFPATLSPTAQEFRPTDPNPNTYYTYSFPYNLYNLPPSIPPPLLLPLPSLPVTVYLPPPSTTPTRTLLLSQVPSVVSESVIRRDLELFGDVRAVQMEKLRDGIVTVHFYDLRQSIHALHEIQEQHMQQQCRLRKHFDALSVSSPRQNSYVTVPYPPPAAGLIAGLAVWAQFTFPVAGGLPDGYNQGTVVVFNLDSDVDAGTIKDIFEVFGCVKELRGTPFKKNQKFVEFYDTRDAARALVHMNGKEINGNPIVVEISRPGGHKNSPNHNRYNIVGSIPPSPIILGRKFPTVSRAYRPPPLPTPPLLQKKTGKKQMEQVGGSSGGGVWSKQRRCSRQTREKYDPRFLIKEDVVISELSISDSRTTVMIKNIPNKYSQKLLLNMLDNHCIHCNEQITGSGDAGGSGEDQPLSSFDFVYLPIDFMNKCNVGYGFVNMTSPEATLRLYKAFHHQNWEVFNSKKICQVSYARLQGVDALKEHFKNSRFPCDAEYMPVVFTPPRDGLRMTEPIPIIGKSTVTTSDHELCLSENECCNSSRDNNNNNGTVDEDVSSDDSCNAASSDNGGVDNIN